MPCCGCGGSRYTEEWRKIRFGGEYLADIAHRVLSVDDDGHGEEDAVLPTNAVKTSKYTPWNFLCKNSYEQLQRFANVWFLILSALMWIGYNTDYFPGLINPYPTLGTLLVMMAITAVSNALDDISRCQADNQMNESQGQVLVKGGKLEARKWRDIGVGDVVYLEGGNEIPVDMVCIASAGNEGLCFVSTANLDGETNLKSKHAVDESQERFVGNFEDKRRVFDGIDALIGDDNFIKAEPPCDNIRDFSGSFCFDGVEKGLSFENVLLRGTKLRNVPWCIGVAIYTGEQTRIMKNSQPTPLKSPTLDSNINTAVGIIICIQLVMGAISMIFRESTRAGFETYWYLQPPREMILPTWLGEWLAFFLLYSNLVPVSLFATIEACNLFQSKFIDSDRQMYDNETKQYAKARSRNLSQEPGQVDYIFSDKTGTLTQNIMDLKRVSIAGKIYGVLDGEKGFNGGADFQRDREGGKKEEIHSFLECLAVAHTVIVSQNGDYEAESPDESALVEAVAHLDYRLKDRKGHNIVVEVLGQDQTYEILCVNEFDSKRKRMSVLAKKKATGEHLLLVKGADNIMLGLSKSRNHQALIEDLHDFSCEGLRTLVIGRRKLSPSVASDFIHEYEEAYKASNRKDALDKAAERMEQDIEILGATAIEDKLQEGVGETIEKVRQAGIKLWVLTGDKLETARNIGFSCKVLTNQMNILVLEDQEQLDELVQKATKTRREIEAWEKGLGESQYTDVALMVTGQALTEVSADDDMSTTFLELAQKCSVVIACRVSPAQKAEMVRLVANKVKVPHRSKPITLAIGDGANDVPMIQEAKIGIGIFGKEGRQAVNNSDIAIAQFRFLQRLLFLHGRWNYIRAARVVMFTFWRNAALVLAMFYYTFCTGNTAIPLFEDLVRGTFNVVTFIPTVCTGIFERDHEEETVMNAPRLYEIGRTNQLLNYWEVLETMMSAFVHSIILLMVIRFAYTGLDMVEIGDVWSYGTIVFTCLMLGVNYRLILVTSAWNWIFWFGITVGCILPYIVFLWVYCSIPTWDVMNTLPMYQVSHRMVSEPLFWLCLLTVPALAATLDLTKRFITYKICITGYQATVKEAVKDAKKKISEAKEKAQNSRNVNEEKLRKRSSGYDGQMKKPLAHEPGSETDENTPLSRNYHDQAYDMQTSDEEEKFGFEIGDTVQWTGEDDYRKIPPGSKGQVIAFTDEFVVVGLFESDASKYFLPSELLKASEGCFGGIVDSIMQQRVGVCWNCMSQDREIPIDFKCYETKCHPQNCSIICSCAMSVFLCISGLVIIWVSSSLEQVRIVYDGVDAPVKPWLSAWKSIHSYFLSEGSHEKEMLCIVNAWNEPKTCNISVPVLRDVAGPIAVYYSLSPFYQNFADYFQSISWKELIGQDVSGDPKYKKACRARQNRLTSEGHTISPCGMQANAMFNDSFEILGMDMIESNIAWDSDVRRFRNPEGYPSPNTTLWLYERFPDIVSESEGVKNPHFAVWVRPDTYPEVRKPYGMIHRDLKQGEFLNISIHARYPLAHIGESGVRKELILTTLSPTLGGKDNSFGWFQLFFALLCFLTACFLLCLAMCRPSDDDDEESDEEVEDTSTVTSYPCSDGS